MQILKWSRATLRSMVNRTATVNLIVTRRCDLACSYCHAISYRPPELDHEQWIQIVERLSGRFAVFTVSGGEPLVYKGVTHLIERISRYGIAALCTNLRVLEGGHLEEMPGLDYLNFSIDHTGDSDVTPKAGYEKLPMIAEYAGRHDFECYGTAVITARNVHAIPGVVRALTAVGIRTNLQLVQRAAPPDAFDSPDKVAALEDLSRELLAMKRGGYPIRESDEYIEGFSSFLAGTSAVKCLAGVAYLAVDADGCLMACQDIGPSRIPVLEAPDLDQALIDLRGTIPTGCRCWWNCYHAYAQWYDSPGMYLARSFRDWVADRIPGSTRPG